MYIDDVVDTWSAGLASKKRTRSRFSPASLSHTLLCRSASSI